MKDLNVSAENLINSLLELSKTEQVCILDSGGVSYLDSHLLIAGIKPSETIEITNENAERSLEVVSQKLQTKNSACIFTISYDFGLKLQNIKPRKKDIPAFPEPDFFLAIFDCLIIHNYKTGKTHLRGNEEKFGQIEVLLKKQITSNKKATINSSTIQSNYSRENYISAIEKIKEYIRAGDTYQTNLTQQFRVKLPDTLSPQIIFKRLRQSHPGSFSAFIKRKNDFVISISPERFFKVSKKVNSEDRIISTSPIKGTRRRGNNSDEDLRLKNELLKSEKDRAENIMIVDLLRNDIGRVCSFGSVKVEKLCELEAHPTLFHLVSTVSGKLRENVDFADIIKAVFPCGSITGAPKIRTMQIIDEIETADRGLSMGAIGYGITGKIFDLPNIFDLNVAIRTMVIRKNEAFFNVGGGIVIDSGAEDEYEESLIKATAIFEALNCEF